MDSTDTQSAWVTSHGWRTRDQLEVNDSKSSQHIAGFPKWPCAGRSSVNCCIWAYCKDCTHITACLIIKWNPGLSQAFHIVFCDCIPCSSSGVSASACSYFHWPIVGVEPSPPFVSYLSSMTASALACHGTSWTLVGNPGQPSVSPRSCCWPFLYCTCMCVTFPIHILHIGRGDVTNSLRNLIICGLGLQSQAKSVLL